MMREEYLTQIIKATHVTEKSQRVAGNKQLVFRVDRRATKDDIREAVETLLDVKVAAVNTLNVKGKVKRFGARLGRRKDFKKAYVTLDKSVDIEKLLADQQV
ncbi:MAG: 50S ribosomal protein L23 [Cardiobacteriaceae bacterium]|nr:50S ribosomal protein L23 [Cardiobacteriaceae bacterium]